LLNLINIIYNNHNEQSVNHNDNNINSWTDFIMLLNLMDKLKLIIY